MITAEQATEAARTYQPDRTPGVRYAQCALADCSANATRHVRVIGPLIPFCIEHLPPTTTDDYGTSHLTD